MALLLIVLLLVSRSQLCDCKDQFSRELEQTDRFNSHGRSHRHDPGEIKFRNMKSTDTLNAKYSQANNRYLHILNKDTNKKTSEAAREDNSVIHFEPLQQTDGYSQYLQTTLNKYLSSIVDLKYRIRSILRQLKYSAKNKWCDVFKLSQEIVLLQKLQTVLQMYSHKERSKGEESLQETRHIKKERTSIQSMQLSRNTQSGKKNIEQKKKLYPFTRIKNSAGVQKSICKNLEVESKEITDFVSELLTLLDDEGLKRGKSQMSGRRTGVSERTSQHHHEDTQQGTRPTKTTSIRHRDASQKLHNNAVPSSIHKKMYYEYKVDSQEFDHRDSSGHRYNSRDSSSNIKTADWKQDGSVKISHTKRIDPTKELWSEKTNKQNSITDRKQGRNAGRNKKRPEIIVGHTGRRKDSISQHNYQRQEDVSGETYKSSITGRKEIRKESDRRQGSIHQDISYKNSITGQKKWRQENDLVGNGWSGPSSESRAYSRRRGNVAGNKRKEGEVRRNGKTLRIPGQVATPTTPVSSRPLIKDGTIPGASIQDKVSNKENINETSGILLPFGRSNKLHSQTTADDNRTYREPVQDGNGTYKEFGAVGDKTYQKTVADGNDTYREPGTVVNGPYQETVADANETYMEPVAIGNETYREPVVHVTYQEGGNKTYGEPVTEDDIMYSDLATVPDEIFNSSLYQDSKTDGGDDEYFNLHEDISDLYDEMVKESHNFSINSETQLISDWEEKAERNSSNSSLVMDSFQKDQNTSHSTLVMTSHHETERQTLRSHSNYRSLNETEFLSHCSTCERKQNEAVCGRNGQTYPTLCHAVNCGLLSLEDVTFGDCNSKNVCADSECKVGEVCTPVTHATCLALYPGPDVELPCQLYTCSPLQKCQNKVFDVCGMNGETYPSLCELHKAGQSLAYSGRCRPSDCNDPVCGVDMNTYPSICHAQARQIPVNHWGKCFQRINEKSDLSSCVRTRELRLCRKTLCRDVVLPAEQCCPVCGGAVTIGLNGTHLQTFVANKERNHLNVIQDLLQKLLSKKMTNRCSLYCYLTVTGHVSVVLEAVNGADHHACYQGLVHLETLVEKAALQSKSGSAYKMLEPGTWVVSKKFSFHHGVLEPVDYLEFQIPGGIDKSYLDFNHYYLGNSSNMESNYYHLLILWLIGHLLCS